jgi:PhnB protein
LIPYWTRTSGQCSTPRTLSPGQPAQALPAYLFIYVADVDAVIARAAELGAVVQRPAQDQFYGEGDGYIIDPFGHGWAVASPVADVTPEELTRRTAELFG